MNTILRKSWSILWQSVVIGLGGMLLIALFIRFTGDFFTANGTTYLTDIALKRGESTFYVPFLFPIFPGVYTTEHSPSVLLLLQSFCCILAVAGVLICIQINRTKLFGVLVKMLFMIATALFTIIPLFRLMHYQASPFFKWFLPLVVGVFAACFALIRHGRLRQREYKMEQIENDMAEHLDRIDRKRYLEQRPMRQKVTDARYYRDLVRLEISTILTGLNVLMILISVVILLQFAGSLPLQTPVFR